MELYVGRLIRLPDDPRAAAVRIPQEMLRRAMIDPWSEVVISVDGDRIVIEAVQDDTDQMDMHAEEFVATHHDLLRKLEDALCHRTG